MADRPAVVDASAVAALLFGEPRGEEVARRLGDGRLVAPTLMRYEVSSVCLKKIDRHREQRKELLQALSLLDRMGIRESGVSHEEVVALASQTGLTAYDAAYLWLAGKLEADLVTLDEKVRRVSRRLGRT